MSIDDMPAGVDMDERIALRLGYTFIQFPDGQCPHVKHWSDPDGKLRGFRPPPFSSDGAHSHVLIERFRLAVIPTHDGRWLAMSNEPFDGRLGSWFERSTGSESDSIAETIALAVSRAALKAEADPVNPI